VRELAVAERPRERRRQLSQARERLLGAMLLERPEARVEEEHRRDGDPLDGPAVGSLVDPQAEVEREGEEQDVDERVLELPDEPAPQRRGLRLGESVGAVRGEEPLRGLAVEPLDRACSILGTVG
jgi:hypothetical protein